MHITLIATHIHRVLWQHCPDLFQLQIYFHRRFFNHKVILVQDLPLVLTDPIPQLHISQPLLRLKLAQIADKCSKYLGVDSIRFPLIEKDSRLISIKTVLLDVVQSQKVVEHSRTEHSQPNTKNLRVVRGGILHVTHLNSHHFLWSQVSLLVVKSLAKVGGLPGPAQLTRHLHLPLSIHKHIMRSYIPNLPISLSFDLLLGRAEPQQQTPQLPLLKLASSTTPVLDLLSEQVAVVVIVELDFKSCTLRVPEFPQRPLRLKSS